MRLIEVRMTTGASTGWANIADALRHFGAYAQRALSLLGAFPARL
jgi:hypothetical protein